MNIERLMPDDLGTINSLKPDTWNDLVPMHAMYIRTPCCHPMKVLMDGATVAIGTAIHLGQTGWLAHIIVAESHQRRGIGRLLVTSLMSLLTETLGCRTVSLLASDMGFPLYASLGFETQTEYVTLCAARGTAASALGRPSIESDSQRSRRLEQGYVRPTAVETFNPILSLSGSSLSNIFEIDAWACGENRSRFLSQYLAGALFCPSEDGRACGAYFPALGDGLVIADDESAGMTLMRRCLEDKGKITVPAENARAISYLRQVGCSETRRMKRMVRGSPFAWNPAGVYNRIGGNLG